MASSSPKVRNEKRFHKQALEEIRILKHLRNQDKENTMNIIHMYEVGERIIVKERYRTFGRQARKYRIANVY